MSHFERARSIVPINSEHGVLELSTALRNRSLDKQRQFFGGNSKTGFFYLYGDDTVQKGNVLECVVSLHGDAISSLYRGHPVFESIGELMRTREGLINELASKFGLSPDSIGVDDQARGRALGLTELGTGQLIDLLEEQSLRGKAQMNTDSHIIEAPGIATDTGMAERKLVEASLDDAHVLKVTEDGRTVAVPLSDA